MQDHISYMLDSMITAVDQSLSYDGIVSVPEMGLEDVKPKTSLTDSLRDGVDKVRVTSTAISRSAGRAASVFKRKQRNSSQPTSKSDIGDSEKNNSEESLALSDQPSEGLTDQNLSSSTLVESERDQRNHFASGQGVAQLHSDDETDRVPSCLPRPSFNRARSEPMKGEGTSPSHLEQEWHMVSPVDSCQEELSEKNGAERRNWRTRFKGGSQGRRARSVQLPDTDQGRLPGNRECEECAQRNEESVAHPLAQDKERLPRKKRSFDSELKSDAP